MHLIVVMAAIAGQIVCRSICCMHLFSWFHAVCVAGEISNVISGCEALCVYSALRNLLYTENIYLQRLPLKTKQRNAFRNY